MCRAADGGMATPHTGADPSFSHTRLGVRSSRTHTTDNHKGERQPDKRPTRAPRATTQRKDSKALGCRAQSVATRRMSDKELRRWVGDSLHGVLGFAENHLTDYVVSLAKNAKSASALLSKLHEADVPKTSATQRFAADLFGRIPRGAAGKAPDAALEQRREAVNALKQNASYGFIDADGDDNDDGGEAEVTAAVQRELAERERERQRKERKRARADERGDAKGDERSQQQQQGGGGSGGAASSADPETQREQDLKERDELAERIRQRDLERTRKVGSGPEAEALARREEEAERLMAAGTAEEKAAALAEARKVSRQVYLEQREKKILEAAKDDLRDDEYLFGDVELTEREKSEAAYKKTVYDLANQRVNISDNVDRYVMPTAYDTEGNVNQEKRMEGLLGRYQEEEKEELNEFQAVCLQPLLVASRPSLCSWPPAPAFAPRGLQPQPLLVASRPSLCSML